MNVLKGKFTHMKIHLIQNAETKPIRFTFFSGTQSTFLKNILATFFFQYNESEWRLEKTP